jgi:hypothetical protein
MLESITTAAIVGAVRTAFDAAKSVKDASEALKHDSHSCILVLKGR